MKELSLHLLDLVENAVAAGAKRVDVVVEEDGATDRLLLSVADDGTGMPEGLLRSATDPFTTTRTTRKVGMGLPLLAAAAEQAGGRLRISSQAGRGTKVEAEFELSHIDRAPLGHIEDTVATIAALHPQLDLHYCHRGEAGCYRIELLRIKDDAAQFASAAEIRRLVRAGRERIRSTA